MPRKIRLVDLFAGCGGLTQGFVETGRFKPVGAVELDPHAAATYAVNFGEHVHVGDIADWVVGSMPLAEVVVGGPPCQGFSALGKQDPDDPRNGLWERYVEALMRIRPAFFVLENVPQFLDSAEYVRFAAETRRRGRLSQWKLEAFLLNAHHYGAGQSRTRAVVIGRDKQIRPIGDLQAAEARLTLKDVLANADVRVGQVDLPESHIHVNGSEVPGAFKTRELHVTRRPTDLSLQRYAAIPYGGNRSDLPLDLQAACWRRHTTGSGDVMGRLRWERPAVTIRTEFYKPEKGRYLHPEEDRPITHYEAALIQGFPESFLWCGTKTSIARQIGNAVPPPLARSIGRALATRL